MGETPARSPRAGVLRLVVLRQRGARASDCALESLVEAARGFGCIPGGGVCRVVLKFALEFAAFEVRDVWRRLRTDREVVSPFEAREHDLESGAVYDVGDLEVIEEVVERSEVIDEVISSGVEDVLGDVAAVDLLRDEFVGVLDVIRAQDLVERDAELGDGHGVRRRRVAPSTPLVVLEEFAESDEMSRVDDAEPDEEVAEPVVSKVLRDEPAAVDAVGLEDGRVVSQRGGVH